MQKFLESHELRLVELRYFGLKENCCWVKVGWQKVCFSCFSSPKRCRCVIPMAPRLLGDLALHHSRLHSDAFHPLWDFLQKAQESPHSILGGTTRLLRPKAAVPWLRGTTAIPLPAAEGKVPAWAPRDRRGYSSGPSAPGLEAAPGAGLRGGESPARLASPRLGPTRRRRGSGDRAGERRPVPSLSPQGKGRRWPPFCFLPVPPPSARAASMAAGPRPFPARRRAVVLRGGPEVGGVRRRRLPSAAGCPHGLRWLHVGAAGTRGTPHRVAPQEQGACGGPASLRCCVGVGS